MTTKLTNQQFLERANKIHNNKYSYLSQYVGGKIDLDILCSIHGIFHQKPVKHLYGHGCPICGGSQLLTNQQFIDKANKKHNNKYRYIGVYKNNKTDIDIECPIHGIFLQSPAAHLRGQGCPKCGHNVRGLKARKTHQTFLEEANLIHSGKYKYVGLYQADNIELEIECPIHGIFEQVPSAHLQGHGCFACGINVRILGRTKTLDTFIKEAQLIHNYKYEYLGPYKHCRIRMAIKCPFHDIFYQAPSNHLAGHGCLQCGLAINVSKGETTWLNSYNIPQEYRQMTIPIVGRKRNFRADALDLDNKIVYEYYGDYWHGNLSVFDANKKNKDNRKTFGELYQLTLEREDIIKAAGYTIISIWEADWKKQVKEAKKLANIAK